jgi:hypothetical protein
MFQICIHGEPALAENLQIVANEGRFKGFRGLGGSIRYSTRLKSSLLMNFTIATLCAHPLSRRTPYPSERHGFAMS